jgi:hypothetical protein
MTTPEGFRWPLPNGLTDTEVQVVYAGLVAAAAFTREMAFIDKAHDFTACLAEANVQWILDELDRRGVPRDTFGNATPEDFED